MYNEHFTENVLWLLDVRKLSRTDLHNLSGVSLATVSDITQGKGNPSMRIQEAIAKALDVALPLLLLPNRDLRYIVELLEALRKEQGSGSSDGADDEAN